MNRRTASGGFTLIELSIVLVIIGLIVGGVLVGQDLIRAAQVRATITQIEKYNAAVNTFLGKYGALPGDMNAATASQFGFAARGNERGGGDGNGIIEGGDNNTYGGGNSEEDGETVMFWVDLSAAQLIDGYFNMASATSAPASITATTSPSLTAFFPAAKLGAGNYIYAYSGGTWTGSSWLTTGVNYFGLSAITGVTNNPDIYTTPALTVAQAYSIDTKVDDGLPWTGRVTAQYLNSANSSGFCWAAADSYASGCSNYSSSNNTPGESWGCYDNGNNHTTPEQYSVEINNGAGVNCALSFQMQTGD